MKKEKINKSINSKKQLIIKVALAAIVVVGTMGIANYTLADENSSNFWDVFRRYQKQMEDRQSDAARAIEHDQVRQAIEANDYATWKEIMEQRPQIKNYINESNFSQFSEMHKLMEEGKIEEAMKIREELGLPIRMGRGEMKGEDQTQSEGWRRGRCNGESKMEECDIHHS